MTVKDVKSGMIDLMKTVYPEDGYKYYSNDVVEDYERPSFFIQMLPILAEPENFNTRNNIMSFHITYMQARADESDRMDKVSELRDLFGLYVQIGNRAVNVDSYDWEFTGQERNILIVTVTISWKDRIEHAVTEPLIESVELKRKLEDE